MDNARWEQVQVLLHEALERPEFERQAFLEAACGDDSELMAEVLAMLKADSGSASLLDRGLPEVAYRMVGAPLDSLAFREFGPYRLKRILGEGGMGVVWLAEREDAGNLVAIKFLPHAGLSPTRRERFAREIKTLAKLKHPFIARLYDAGTLTDGTPWFVMEYVEGVHFTEYCRSLYDTLANSYDQLGDLPKADSLLHLALKERTSLLGPNSKEVAESLLGLGTLRLEQARYPEAETLIRKGLAIDTQQLPKDDPIVAKYRTALGLALMKLGAYNSAIEEFNESIRVQTGRPDLINDFADNLTDLASAHFDLGHYAESESFTRQVLVIDRRLHPGNHAGLAMDLINLGNVEQELTHYTDAEQHFREALAIDQSWYGKDNLETGNVMRILAQDLILENRFQEAAAFGEQALTDEEQAYGKVHPRVAMAVSVLGRVALKRGAIDEAKADFTRTLQIYRSIYGEKHYYVAVALSDLGSAYLQEKNYGRAAQLFEEAVHRFSDSLSPDHPRTGRAQIALGRNPLASAALSRR